MLNRFLIVCEILSSLLYPESWHLDGPRIAANLPTPWVSIWEHISIGAFLVWVIVLAFALLPWVREGREEIPEWQGN